MKCSSRVVLWTADTWKATAGRIRRRTDWISKRQRRFRPDTNCFNFHYLWSFWKREANRRGLGIDRVPPGPRFSSEFATLSLTPFLINEVQRMDGDAAISNHRKGSETKQKNKEGISQVAQLMFREPQTWNYLDPLSWKHRQYNRPDGPLDWEVAPAQSASEEHESSSSFFSPLCADIFILKLFPFPLALCLRVARPASMGSDRETWWVPLIRKRVGREDSRSFIDFWPVSSYFLASIASSETRGKK